MVCGQIWGTSAGIFFNEHTTGISQRSLGQGNLVAALIISRQIVIQLVIVAFVGDEDMGGGCQPGIAVERARGDRDPIGAIGLSEEGRTALAAKTPPCGIARPVPFQPAVFDHLEIFHAHARGWHVVAGLLSALATMASNHLFQRAGNPITDRTTKTGADFLGPIATHHSLPIIIADIAPALRRHLGSFHSRRLRASMKASSITPCA